MDEIMRDAEKKRQQEIKDLEFYSKNLCELVVTEKFTIDDALGESHETSFTPHSEIMRGGRSPVYKGGFTSKITLKVSPDDKDVPIRTIKFNGFSRLKAGDYIYAQIPRYEEKRVKGGFSYGQNNNDKIFYFDRDFNSEEFAIELALLSPEGNILRRERSVNYKKFIKE